MKSPLFSQQEHSQIVKETDFSVRISDSILFEKLSSYHSNDNFNIIPSIKEVIDSKSIQVMFDDLFKITGVPIAITDLNGELIVGSGWQDICIKFHRKHPETRKNCIECDALLSKNIKPGTFRSYLCKNHLWDNITPLIINNIHAGNLHTGQFFYEDGIPDDQIFIDQAEKYGFDKKEYMEALRKIPVWSREKIESIFVYYSKLASMISSLSHATIVLDKMAEEAKEAEWKFRALFEKGPIGVAYHQMIYDNAGKPIDYKFLDANDTYLELTGVNPRGKLVTEAFPGIEKSQFDWIGTFGDVAKNGKTIRFEQYLEVNKRWYECVAYQYKPNHFVAAFFEITKRKNAEISLKESEEKYRNLHENTGIGIGYYKPDGTVISFNKLAANRMNGEPEDFAGKSIFSLFPSKEAEIYFKRIQDCCNTREPLVFEDSISLPSGDNYFLSTFSKVLNQNNEISGIQIISQDISKLRSTEYELNLSIKRLESIFLVAPTGIGVVKNRVISEVNPKICELTGYSQDELIGKSARFLYPSQEEYERVGNEIKNQIKEKGTGEVESIWRKKGGSELNVILSSTPIDPSDHLKGVTFTVLDITNRKKAEFLLQEKTDEIESQNEEYQQINEELIQTNNELHIAKLHAEESDRLKTAFLQNMSHEIRTPMNAIMGFSSLLKANFENKPKLEKFSEIINQRCNDLLEIINDILDIAKIESGQLSLNIEECNIDSLFSELNSFFSEHQKNIGKEHIQFKLKSQLSDYEHIIYTDSGKLKQIFINLIGNAFKFTETGSVEGGCKIDELGRLVFFVSDTGIGIPEDKQTIIYERFTQLNPGNNKLVSGTGLGLSIVKGLVTLLGGEIELDSQPGKGSNFTFSFPLNNLINPQPMKSHEEIFVNLDSSEKRILLVEDDLYNTEYLLEVLTSAGYKVVHTELGREAVKLALKEDFDLILMDVRLPDISGYDATKIIRPLKPNLKIIAQTAYASNGEKQKALETGCNDYISKPTRDDLLLKMINKHLITLSTENNF